MADFHPEYIKENWNKSEKNDQRFKEEKHISAFLFIDDPSLIKKILRIYWLLFFNYNFILQKI